MVTDAKPSRYPNKSTLEVCAKAKEDKCFISVCLHILLLLFHTSMKGFVSEAGGPFALTFVTTCSCQMQKSKDQAFIKGQFEVETYASPHKIGCG